MNATSLTTLGGKLLPKTYLLRLIEQKLGFGCYVFVVKTILLYNYVAVTAKFEEAMMMYHIYWDDTTLGTDRGWVFFDSVASYPDDDTTIPGLRKRLQSLVSEYAKAAPIWWKGKKLQLRYRDQLITAIWNGRRLNFVKS